jgi:hypothetical protein
VTVLDLVWLTVMVVSLPGVVRCRFAVGERHVCVCSGCVAGFVWSTGDS